MAEKFWTYWWLWSGLLWGLVVMALALLVKLG